MGNCDSIDTIENSNFMHTRTYRGRGMTTVIKSYQVPTTNQHIENKTIYLKITNAMIFQILMMIILTHLNMPKSGKGLRTDKNN
jgi:hypothetical protein